MKSRQSWADLYAFEVVRESDTPLFRQLYLQLRSAILSRRLRPGTKLPSTRELAAQLGVSRSAAVAAYEQLLAEGYTSGRHGSGTYISPDLPEPIAGNPQKRKKPATAITSRAIQMQPLGDFVDVTVQSDQRPFNLGRTLIDHRTLELWRKLSARTFRSLDATHLYGPAVRCKPNLSKWRGMVLRICIRPLHRAFVLLAIMDIRAHPISFSERP